MKKNEIIQFHTFLCKFRNYLENEFLEKIGEKEFNNFFAEYDRLGVNPVKINRSLSEQKNAMKTLGRCISSFLNFEYAAKKKPDTKIVKNEIEYSLKPAEYLAAVG